MTAAPQRRAARSEWAVLVAAALLWLPVLGAHDLWAPDEPRIAQVAEELRAAVAGPAGVVGGGDSGGGVTGLILLQLDGKPYTQKPPLYYWLAAAFGAPAGHVGAVAARAPSALAGLACLALTMAIARRLFGARHAAWSGALLLLAYRFSDLAQRAQLDVLLTAFELAAWLSWLRLERAEIGRGRALASLHAALGAGMLVKGPVALLPLAAIGLQLRLEGRREDLAALFAPRWLALSIGPLLVWAAAALALAPSGFFEEAVVENLFGRFLGGSSHARPFYYYAYQLPADFFPTSLLLPFAALSAFRARRDPTPRAAAWRGISIWTLCFFLFFSLSAGKRGLYLLPIFPALAIACSAVLVDSLSGRQRLPLRAGCWLVAIAACGAAGAAAAALWGLPERLVDAGLVVPRRFLIGTLTTLLGSIGAAVWLLLRGGRGRALERAAVAVATGVLLQANVVWLLLPSLDAERSLRPIAAAASALALPGERIGVVNHTSMIAGLTYYSGGIPGRYEDLPDHAAIEDFVASGRGQVLVSEVRRAWALDPAPYPIHARFRTGEREIWLLAPSGRGEGPDPALARPQRRVQPRVRP